MMERDEFLKSGLIEEYVLGLCDAHDKRIVEQMAANDQEIRQLIDESQHAVNHYCRSLHKKNPASLKKKIISRLEQKASSKRDSVTRDMHPNQWSYHLWQRIGPIATAIGLISLTLLAHLISQNRDLSEKLFIAENRNADMQNELSSSLKKHQITKNKIDFLQDQNTLHVTLAGMENNQPLAMIYWNRAKEEAAMQIIHLPDLHAHQSYQLWANIQGKMVNMAVIDDPDAKWISLPFLPQAQSLNITLEKEGGSDHPNTDELVCSGRL